MDNFKDLLDEINKEAKSITAEDLSSFDKDSFNNKIDSKIKEKLGVSLLEMQTAIGNYVKENNVKMAEQFVTMAPNGNWGLMMEDQVEIAKFMKSEASKPENWNIACILPDRENKGLLEFSFNCKAIDDGDVLKGYAYVSATGKVRHAFACGE